MISEQQKNNLQKILTYTFNDEAWLIKALTHRSASGKHNERLEFLGDSVLNFVIAETLFDTYSKATEGQLSRLRASLVKEDTLAEIAKGMELGDYIILGTGELRSGGFRRKSILADTLEALFGAVYRDSDFSQAQEVILSLYKDKLDTISITDNLKDPKSQLQELLQQRKAELPKYEVTDIVGEPHNQTFTVKCFVDITDTTTQGKGRSRRLAEQDAAQQALHIIKEKL